MRSWSACISPVLDAGCSRAGSALAYIGLGSLVFLPGAYASSIAAAVWLGVDGVDISMMPRMVRSST